MKRMWTRRERDRIAVPQIETGIDWNGVRRDLDWESWSTMEGDPDQLERTIYLGSILSLTPSGKMYAPWACSNVDACPICHGKGTLQRRLTKRERRALRVLRNRTERKRRKALKRREMILCLIPPGRSSEWKATVQCPRCEGSGSAEARDDETWNELLEQEASERHLFVTGSEGDGCDILVGEAKDREEPLPNYSYPCELRYYGKRKDEREPDFGYQYCGDCATKERDERDTEFLADVNYEGEPEACENCGKAMDPEYGNAECPRCYGEEDPEAPCLCYHTGVDPSGVKVNENVTPEKWDYYLNHRANYGSRVRLPRGPSAETVERESDAA